MFGSLEAMECKTLTTAILSELNLTHFEGHKRPHKEANHREHFFVGN